MRLIKKGILLNTFVCLCLSGIAQTPTLEWVNRIGVDTLTHGWGAAIVADAAGNVYTTGSFSDTTDFDPGPGIYNLISNGWVDAFVSKSDPAGNLIWVTRVVGGATGDVPHAIVLDSIGNIYVTGAYDVNESGDNSMFIVKLDTSGTIGWLKQIGLGANSDVQSFSLTVDLSGNTYLSGYFKTLSPWTLDFDPGVGTAIHTSYGSSQDIFILKLDSTGNFVWVKQIGGTAPGGDDAKKIIIDPTGNLLVGGRFSGTVDFDSGPGTNSLTSASSSAFLLKLDTSGNFIWVKNTGSSTNQASSESVVFDAFGNIFISGTFTGTTDFDPGSGTYNLVADSSSTDISLLKLDPAGNFLWAKRIGGSISAYAGLNIAQDPAGNFYLTGFFGGIVDFDPGAGIFYLYNSTATMNIFILKLNTNGDFLWAVSFDGNQFSRGYSIFVDGFGNVYTTGSFGGTVDFDPGPGVVNSNCASLSIFNIFVHKMNQVITGYSEHQVMNDIGLYPNPTNSIVTLSGIEKESTIEIFNVLGEKIISIQCQNTSVDLNLSELANGIYFVKVGSEKGTLTKRIVKQ